MQRSRKLTENSLLFITQIRMAIPRKLQRSSRKFKRPMRRYLTHSKFHTSPYAVLDLSAKILFFRKRARYDSGEDLIDPSEMFAGGMGGMGGMHGGHVNLDQEMFFNMMNGMGGMGGMGGGGHPGGFAFQTGGGGSPFGNMHEGRGRSQGGFPSGFGF